MQIHSYMNMQYASNKAGNTLIMVDYQGIPLESPTEIPYIMNTVYDNYVVMT